MQNQIQSFMRANSGRVWRGCAGMQLQTKFSIFCRRSEIKELVLYQSPNYTIKLVFSYDAIA